MTDTPTEREWVTWRTESGDPIADGMTWVEDPDGLEFFASDSEPTRLIRQTWKLIDEQVGTYYPPGCHVDCLRCGGEGIVDHDEGFEADD